MLVLYLAVLLGATTAENGTLYCRCGMDHSNPYDDKAKTDCSVIQYHDQVEGVAGVYTGIKGFVKKKGKMRVKFKKY